MKERNARPMPGFVKFSLIGQTVAGQIERFVPPKGDGSGFFVLSPAFVRDVGETRYAMYRKLNLGLSADIAAKCPSGAKDVGKYMVFRYSDNEPTNKGAEKRIFRVLELSLEEFNRNVVLNAIDKRNEYDAALEAGTQPQIFQAEHGGTAEPDGQLPLESTYGDSLPF